MATRTTPCTPELRNLPGDIQPTPAQSARLDQSASAIKHRNREPTRRERSVQHSPKNKDRHGTANHGRHNPHCFEPWNSLGASNKECPVEVRQAHGEDERPNER